MDKSIKSNIWKYYLYRMFGSAVFTSPIWILYLRDNGLSLTQSMLLQTFYIIIMLFATIPMGALADMWGRKYVLIISQFLNSFGYIIFFLSHTFTGFLIGEFFMGIATASYFGVQEAFIYDTLKQIKEINLYKKVQGNIYAINDMMFGIVGMFGAAIAAAISMRFTFGISIIPVVIAGIICFSFKEPEHKKQLYEKGYFQHIKETLQFTAQHKEIKFIIGLSALLGGFMFITFFMFQVYFKEMGVSIQHIGILYAVMFAFSAIGGKICHYVEDKLKEKYTAIFVVGVPAVLFLISALTKTWIGIPIVILTWLTSGSLKNVFTADFINKHASSHHRATVMSISIIIGNIFFAIISPIFGFIADHSNVRNVFLVMSIVLFMYLGYLVWYFRKR
ncbi:MFS transporter [Candidatus Woesearchaeota archaeon]|jgi:MFS family permease|nr:MFS transporter [Candidatus Woesearchaeota archaeon]